MNERTDEERTDFERKIAEELARAIDKVAREIAQKYGVEIRPRTRAEFDLNGEHR